MTAHKAQRTPKEKVRVLQRKLYRTAKAQPQRTFGVLYDKVRSLEVLWVAWEQVRRNHGALPTSVHHRLRPFYNFTEQDPGVSEREGVSVFYKDRSGNIFHTYSTYARGIDMMNVDYQYLDLVPKGRDENGKGPFWVQRHDEYGRD